MKQHGKPRTDRRPPPGFPRGDVLFVAAVALLLLVAAILTNLPAVIDLSWPGNVFKTLMWIITVYIVLTATRRRQDDHADRARPARDLGWRIAPLLWRPDRAGTPTVALAVVLLFAVAAHYNFGRFHQNGRFLHYHELYHYYMGSKYFPELGYDGLYVATYRALHENDSSAAAQITVVKNLRTYRLESATIALQRSADLQLHFSEQRWREFVRDVRFFQSRIPVSEWRVLLVDHGYNGTPFWTMLGSWFSAGLTLSDGALYALTALDPLLTLAMLILVWRAFGLQTALLFAIFFYANFFAPFGIVGGAFLRQLWLAALVAFICLLRIERRATAGGCVALAVLDRAFPLVFLLPSAVLFVRDAWRQRTLRTEHGRVLIGFVLTLFLLGAASAAGPRGPASWRSWYENVSAHNQWFYFNQISLRNLFVVTPASALRVTADGWDEALWQRERETLAAGTSNTLTAVRVLMVLLLIVLILKEPDPKVPLALLAFGPFLLFYPANYYMSILGIAVICWRSAPGLALTVLALQGLFWLLAIRFPRATDLELLHWMLSLGLMAACTAFLVRAVWRAALPRRATALGLAGGALLLIGAVSADVVAPRARPARRVLDLTTRDVRALSAATARSEHMAEWGNAWSREDHLLFIAAGPGSHAIVTVPADATGRYRVTIDYSTAPPFGLVALSVNDQAGFEPVNLFSSGVGLRTAVHRQVPLQEGPNAFNFAVLGKDPAAAHYHFAMDRIVIEREPDATDSPSPAANALARRTALDQALAWVRAHPADSFDGGRDAICAEMAAFYCLSRHSGLAQIHPACVEEIRTRISRLDGTPLALTQPEKYENLVLVAHIARQLGLDFHGLKAVAADVARRAQAVYADRTTLQSLHLCTYLNRTGMAAPVPCPLEQSILYHEYRTRSLFNLLRGEVDRAQADAVLLTLLYVAADISVLTDFGSEPPPPSGILADREYWAELCEHGLRWARETGNILVVARLVHAARSLGLESQVPSFDAGIEFLIERQRADGCFGVSNAQAPNAYRDGVLAGIMALAAGL